MSISREILRDAAFWHQRVCLECEGIQPHNASEDTACIFCEGDEVFEARHILRCADLVREAEDD